MLCHRRNIFELEAGFKPEQILFISNNASKEEMQYAIDRNITISIDSYPNLSNTESLTLEDLLPYVLILELVQVIAKRSSLVEKAKIWSRFKLYSSSKEILKI